MSLYVWLTGCFHVLPPVCDSNMHLLLKRLWFGTCRRSSEELWQTGCCLVLPVDTLSDGTWANVTGIVLWFLFTFFRPTVKFFKNPQVTGTPNEAEGFLPQGSTLRLGDTLVFFCGWYTRLYAVLIAWWVAIKFHYWLLCCMTGLEKHQAQNQRTYFNYHSSSVSKSAYRYTGGQNCWNKSFWRLQNFITVHLLQWLIKWSNVWYSYLQTFFHYL